MRPCYLRQYVQFLVVFSFHARYFQLSVSKCMSPTHATWSPQIDQCVSPVLAAWSSQNAMREIKTLWEKWGLGGQAQTRERWLVNGNTVFVCWCLLEWLRFHFQNFLYSNEPLLGWHLKYNRQRHIFLLSNLFNTFTFFLVFFVSQHIIPSRRNWNTRTVSVSEKSEKYSWSTFPVARYRL